MGKEEIVCLLALNKILNYNGKAAIELLSLTGSAKGVFELSTDQLATIFNNSSRYISQIKDQKNIKEAEHEYEWVVSQGIELLCPTDPSSGYPRSLLNCEDYPILLYKKGALKLNNSPVISVVGTRRATASGIKLCENIVQEISELTPEAVIVSGLAYGIDITAHRAALKYGLATVAVLGNSIDKIYPVAHSSTAKEICKSGAVISEFPRSSQGHKINFLQRNRIIAGICDALLVVESDDSGGSMITATLASSYGKEIFAVPGRLSDPRSRGCNKLIAENRASLFLSVPSFLESCRIPFMKRAKEEQREIIFGSEGNDKEKILVALTSERELSIDQLSINTDIEHRIISTYLLELELEGKIIALPGKRYTLS